MLLEYVRTVRNSGAHAGSSDLETENLRHTASIIARSAQLIWKAASAPSKLSPLVVQKTWS